MTTSVEKHPVGDGSKNEMRTELSPRRVPHDKGPVTIRDKCIRCDESRSSVTQSRRVPSRRSAPAVVTSMTRRRPTVTALTPLSCCGLLTLFVIANANHVPASESAADLGGRIGQRPARSSSFNLDLGHLRENRVPAAPADGWIPTLTSDGPRSAPYDEFLRRVKRHADGDVSSAHRRDGSAGSADAVVGSAGREGSLPKEEFPEGREGREALPHDRDFGKVFSYQPMRYPEPPSGWFKDRYDTFNTAWIDDRDPPPTRRHPRPQPGFHSTSRDQWRDRDKPFRKPPAPTDDGWVQADRPLHSSSNKFPGSYQRPHPGPQPDRHPDRDRRPWAPARPDHHQHLVDGPAPDSEDTRRRPGFGDKGGRPSSAPTERPGAGHSSDRLPGGANGPTDSSPLSAASSTTNTKRTRPPWQQNANSNWGPGVANVHRRPEPPPGSFNLGANLDYLTIVGDRDPLKDDGFLTYLAAELDTSPSEVLEALKRPVPAGYNQQQQEFLKKLYAEFLVKSSSGSQSGLQLQQQQQLDPNGVSETTTPFFISSTPQQQQEVYLTSSPPQPSIQPSYEIYPGNETDLVQSGPATGLIVEDNEGGDGVSYNRQFVNLPGGDVQEVFRFCGCPARPDHVCAADGWNYANSCVLRCMTARWQHLRECHMYKTGITGRIFDRDNNRPYVMKVNFGDERVCHVSIAAQEGMCGVEFKKIEFDLGGPHIESCAGNYIMLDGTRHCLDGESFPDVVRFNAEMRVDLTYKLENDTPGFDLFYSQVPCDTRLEGNQVAGQYRRTSPCEIYLSGPTGRFMSSSLKVNDWRARCRVTVVAEDNRCGLELKFNRFNLIRTRQCQDEYFKVAGKRYCGRGPHLMPSEAAFDGKFQLPFEFRLNSNKSEVDFFYRQMNCETLATKGISVRHEGPCIV